MLWKFIARRFAALVGILFVISLGAFFLIHLLPGDPIITILGPSATNENRRILMAQLGLDQPIYQQYLTWLGNVLHGNLGFSFIQHQNVTTTIANSFPIDVELVVLSQFIAFSTAVPLAMAAAKRPNSLLDRLATTATFAALALPSFVLIVLGVLVFAVHFHIFPGPGAYVPISQGFWTNIHAMILPSLVLAIGSVVVYFRLLRSDLVATLQEDYILMARSKGASDRRIMWRHAFRPSSVALLATAAINIGSLIAGAFVVEYLLQLPGLGYSLVNAIGQDDYLTIQAIVLVVAVSVVVINFFADFMFSIIDPRISRD